MVLLLRPLAMGLAAGLAAFTIGASSGAAFAGNAYSSLKYFTSASRSYYNQAGIHTDHANNHHAHASTRIQHRNGNLPAGYIGAQPVGRNSSGSVICTGTWRYTGGTASGMSTVGCNNNNTHSTYSSGGSTRTWTGSSYYQNATLRSPNQTS